MSNNRRNDATKPYRTGEYKSPDAPLIEELYWQ